MRRWRRLLAGGRGPAPRNGKAALVLGALVYRDGTPSPVVEDRVRTAARRCRDGRVPATTRSA